MQGKIIRNAKTLLEIGNTKIMAQLVKDVRTNKVEARVYCENEDGVSESFRIRKSAIDSNCPKLESELKDLDIDIEKDQINAAQEELNNMLASQEKVVLFSTNLSQMREVLIEELKARYQTWMEKGNDETNPQEVYCMPDKREIACTREVLKKIAEEYDWNTKKLLDEFESVGWLKVSPKRKQCAINNTTRAYVFYMDEDELEQKEVA